MMPNDYMHKVTTLDSKVFGQKDLEDPRRAKMKFQILLQANLIWVTDHLSIDGMGFIIVKGKVKMIRVSTVKFVPDENRQRAPRRPLI